MSKQTRRGVSVLSFVVLATLSLSFTLYRIYNRVGAVDASRVESFAPRFAIKVPQPWQLFQRDENDMADIPVHLLVYGGLSGQISARHNGGEWQVLTENFKGTEFNGFLKNQPVGQGDLEVKVGTLLAKTVETVSVGDILLCDGQSNNSGVFDHQYQSTDLKFKPSMYRLDVESWMPLRDPTNPYWEFFKLGDKGSVWPLVAELYVKEFNVPVAIIDTSMGGSGLAVSLNGSSGNDWLPQHGPYKSLLRAVSLATEGRNTVKFLLSFRGETDAIERVSTDGYKAEMSEYRERLAKDLGHGNFPIIIGQIAFFTKWRNPSTGLYTSSDDIVKVRLAQQEVVDGINFFSGPDGSRVEIGPDNLHFSSDQAKRVLADFWMDSIRKAAVVADKQPEVVAVNR
ncbi:MAG: sialate O-acetylesterase [bacterium]|nr:sialate O-acetylesterase [bacterium]